MCTHNAHTDTHHTYAHTKPHAHIYAHVYTPTQCAHHHMHIHMWVYIHIISCIIYQSAAKFFLLCCSKCPIESGFLFMTMVLVLLDPKKGRVSFESYG